MSVPPTATSGSASIALIIGIVGLLAVAGSWLVFQSSENEAVTATESAELVEAEKMMDESVEMMKEDDADLKMMDEESKAEMMDDDMSAKSEEVSMADKQPLAAGVYTQYTESLLKNAQTGPVVLFFHAAWCPSCRGLENDIEANLTDIPAGMTILKVDYDTATALKQKYGVVRQHTLVQVDENGEAIQTLTGVTSTLDQVVSQI